MQQSWTFNQIQQILRLDFVRLPQSIWRSTIWMMERSSVLIDKTVPSSTLKVAVVSCPLGFDFSISTPSIRTDTSPSLLQLAKVNSTLPAPQKLVEISSLVHPVAIQLFSLIRLNFRSHVFPGSTKRSFSSIALITQPPSFMLPKELKSLIPWLAQAAVGPVKAMKYLIITNYNF